MLVYAGGARDPAKDALLGFFTVELEGLIATDRLKGEFPLQAPSRAPFAPPGASLSPHAYAGAVAAEVRPSDALEAYMLGGRVLRLTAPVELRDVPPAWLPPAPAEAPAPAAAAHGKGAAPAHAAHPPPPAPTPPTPAALAAAAEEDGARHRYALTLALPAGGADAADGAPPPPPRTAAFAGGRLRYVYEGAPEPAPAGSRLLVAAPSRPPSAPAAGTPSKPGSAKGPPAAAHAAAPPASPPAAAPPPPTPPPPGRWVVAWAPEHCRAFLCAASVAALHAHLSGGGALAVGVRRLLVAPVEPVAAFLRGGADERAAAGALALHAAANAPAGAPLALKLPGGVRMLEEAALFRGAAAAPADALLLPGSAAAAVEVPLAPAAVSVEEAAMEAAAAERRAAAFSAAEAAVGAGAGAGAGAKPGSAKGKPSGAPAPTPAPAAEPASE